MCTRCVAVFIIILLWLNVLVSNRVRVYYTGAESNQTDFNLLQRANWPGIWLKIQFMTGENVYYPIHKETQQSEKVLFQYLPKKQRNPFKKN